MRNTAQYILKRLLYMIPMVLVITFLIYGGLELTPGDAISHMIPPDQLANVNPEQLEALRESYGLNDPFLLRYVRWLGELLHGNFGYSITSGVPIKDILLQLFPATLELSLAALAAIYGYYLLRLNRCRPTDRSTCRTARKAAARMGGRREAVTFTFREAFFVVLGDRGAEQVDYRELLRTAESDYCFILQIQRGFFLVPKEDFTTGAAEDFGAFLEEKTGRAVKRLDY